MKNFMLNTAFNIGNNPSDRAERFAINLGVYLLLLIAIGFGFAGYVNRELPLFERFPLYIPLVGGGFLLLHLFMAIAFKDQPDDYLDRTVELSRNGIIFPALALPFTFIYSEHETVAIAMAWLMLFAYLFIWLGHIFILAKTKTSFVWYVLFTLNRFIAIIGGAYLVYGLA